MRINRKGYGGIIITILAVIIVGVLGGIVYKKTAFKVDETASWKTYTNTAWGYSLKYPAEYELRDNNLSTSDKFTRGISIEVYDPANRPIEFGPGLVINITKQPFDTSGKVYDTAEDFAKGILKSDEMTIKEVTLGEVKGVEASGRKVNEVLGITEDFVSVYALRDDVGFQLLYRPTNYPHFQTIASTFKIISVEEQASDLETYQNPEYGFESLPTACIDEVVEGGAVPVITSISPNSGPIGREIEIRGCNLAGFEGDLDVIFLRNDGAEIPLYGGTASLNGNSSKFIKINVHSYCESGFETGRYSGITSACEMIEATPGAYKVYVTAWGKKSNEAIFTIIQAEASDWKTYRDIKFGFEIKYPPQFYFL